MRIDKTKRWIEYGMAGAVIGLVAVGALADFGREASFADEAEGTAKKTADVSTNVKEFEVIEPIALGGMPSPVNLTVGTVTLGAVSSASTAVSVSTGSDYGYTLMISATEPLMRKSDDGARYFEVAGKAAGGRDGYGTVLNPGRLMENTWGFAVPAAQTGTLRSGFNTIYEAKTNAFGYQESSLWAGVSSKATLIRRSDAKTADGGESTDVFFAVRTAKDTDFGSYSATVTFTAVANDPVNTQDFFVEMDENMIPVYYDGTTLKVADRDNAGGQWYNYDMKRWANAVTVKAEKLAYYQQLAVDKDITVADVIGYFVYIPRYRYQVKTLDFASRPTIALTFDIVFENPLTDWYDKTTAEGLTEPGDWMTHPAFTLGDVELPGIWVGKFLNSGVTDGTQANGTMVKVVPNVAATSTTLNNHWNAVTGNSWYTFRVPHSLTANTDSHILRNSEWSAVAYLTTSRYGQGQPEPAAGSATTGGGDYAGNPLRSSTGNITGVYDINGVAEVVMANIDGTTSASSGLAEVPDAKYVESLGVLTAVTDCTLANYATVATICIGQALAETSGWRSDTATWVTAANAWMTRGATGVFDYQNSTGVAVYSRTALTGGKLWQEYCANHVYGPTLCKVLEPEGV